MRSLLLSIACISVALLCGCADVVVTTQVGPDGSWTRRLEFRMDVKNPMGEEGNLGKIFDLPGGEGWTVKDAVDGKKKIFTAERSGKAGDAVVSGLLIKTKKGAVVLSTDASVREIAPGRFEYREVIKWKGKKPKDYLQPNPVQVAAAKSALPPGLADDAKIIEFIQAAQRKFLRRLLGPCDPMVPQLLMHPRLGMRRLKKMLAEDIILVLKDMFGDRIEEKLRAGISKKIVDLLEIEKTEEKAQPKSPGTPGEEGGAASEDEAEFVPLTFTLKVPGKIVAADGEIDRANGEVVWDFYAQSAELEDVILTATFESKP